MKISELPKATAVNDTDAIPLVQEGETKQASRKAFVGVVPNDLKLADRHLQLTANGEAVGDGIALPDFKKFELWNDITLSEDVASISMSKTDDGKPYNSIKKLFFLFTGKTVNANPLLVFNFNGGNLYQMWNRPTSGGNTSNFTVWGYCEKIESGMFWSIYSKTALTDSDLDSIQGIASAQCEVGSGLSRMKGDYDYFKKANKWTFGATSDTYKLKAGSRILVWGVQDDD